MKRYAIFIILFSVALFSAGRADAQEQAWRDSIVYRPAAAVDSTVYGKSIFASMPAKANGDKADVKVHQSQEIANAMQTYIAENPRRTITGYRVRIYFSNDKNARNESEATMEAFKERYPGIPAYRSYQNPSFKVTVGDFRTRSEAMEMMQRLKSEYPSSFVTKENINYPTIDAEHPYVVDTVKIRIAQNIL